MKNSDFNVEIEDLLSDLGEIDEQKDEVSSANGGLRSTIKRILEERGYHKAALAIVRQLTDMPISKRADVRRTLMPMLDALAPHWDEQERDMIDRAEAEATDMEGDMAAE